MPVFNWKARTRQGAVKKGVMEAQNDEAVMGVLRAQSLLPRANGPGRAMALEVMVPNSAIRNLIREDKIHQLYSSMQVGQEKFEMQTMNQALAILYQRRMINLEMAMARSPDNDELRNLIAPGGGANRAPAQRPTASRRKSA